MSPPNPTPPALPPTPVYAYGSLPSQSQPSLTTTNPRHPVSTVPPVILLPRQPQMPPLVVPSTPRMLNVPLPSYSPPPNPSPPYSTSTFHSSSYNLLLHPLLCYSQHCKPALVWDMRTDPTPASLLQVPVPISYHSTTSAHALVIVSEHELYQPATAPPRHVLRLFCGIVPPTGTWGTITVNSSASSQACITVLDVLNAVRECMRTPIMQAEWDALCKKQQDRVNETFDSRWRMSRTPAMAREEGVLRQDFLLLHTLWGGLTPSFVERDAAVLTLRRPDP
ncbi:hypothetical protein C0989_006279 [Termitomyces sp. Mn162]|nr:hypothetical protein C0989_006279 [Termitomyces sp. Mn162]